jgi:hypothetical protein
LVSHQRFKLEPAVLVFHVLNTEALKYLRMCNDDHSF